MRVVAYYRVSTDEQGQSGLGLEAQQEAIQSLAASRGWHIRSHHTEVESGKRADRPVLAQAIAEARNVGATLVVAKLDRLSRDASFLLSLFDGNVPILFGDMPELDASTSTGRLQLVVMAGFAEFERKRISERTKSALAAAKARGVKLGGLRPGSAAGTGIGVKQACAARAAKADAKALQLIEPIRRAEEAGASSLAEIADMLNEFGVQTPSGRGRWMATTVARVKERANACK
jgi:DNA invertase Pin-like site-specific DNA recombinase